MVDIIEDITSSFLSTQSGIESVIAAVYCCDEDEREVESEEVDDESEQTRGDSPVVDVESEQTRGDSPVVDVEREVLNIDIGDDSDLTRKYTLVLTNGKLPRKFWEGERSNFIFKMFSVDQLPDPDSVAKYGTGFYQVGKITREFVERLIESGKYSIDRFIDDFELTRELVLKHPELFENTLIEQVLVNQKKENL